MDGGRDGEPDNVIPHASRRDCSQNIFRISREPDNVSRRDCFNFSFSGSLKRSFHIPHASCRDCFNLSKYFLIFRESDRVVPRASQHV